MTENPAAAEIWAAIQASNRKWADDDDPEAACDLYHDEVVLAGPSGEPAHHGRPAMVRSYIEFCGNAETISFRETEHEIDVFGDTAVATYGFEVSYELGGRHDEIGRELLVFKREGERWRAVWRMPVSQRE